MLETRDPVAVQNWNDSAGCAPVPVVYPRTVDDLEAIVKDKDKYPSPVRAGGELHSLNPCFTTDGTLVMMKHFKEIGEPADGTITVGAGVTMIELRDKLRNHGPHGLQIEVVPEIGNATAGSVACCGTKDASLGASGLAQISSTVVAVEMVDATGTRRRVDENTTASPTLAEVRSSYGLLGLLYSVTFSTHELQKISYRYTWLTLSPLPPIEKVLGGADGFLGFLLPYRGGLLVERRKILDSDTKIRRRDRGMLWWRNFIWEKGSTFFTRFAPSYNLGFWISDWSIRAAFAGLAGLAFVGFEGISHFRAHRTDAMINFKHDRPYYFDFAFWAVPASKWNVVIPEYLKFCEGFKARTGYRPALPTEVYFIRKDNHSLLSFSPKEDIFTLDMVDCRPRRHFDGSRWCEMNQEFNHFVVRHGGRPLFNQTKELSRAIVWKALGGDWERFCEIRAREDPDGRFLNDFFRALV
jgi:FAD binding domain-containing protein/D-arabinono-1,4-lactone oxidase